ncbi:MAG: tryptophan synthase subunit alpha [Methylococcaceae bacterium]|nr:tryptophan synthase subunit alpha [Methylococcaceae bacterium]MCI0734195.1 tryptophan synthase subunit alpha [Methylococcaceae bacterium]
MNRIERRFSEFRKSGRKALIPFITAGDPSPDFTVTAMHGLVEAGADLIELGVPFSDPMADGPVIQRASERALANKVNLRKVLTFVREFRVEDPQTPVILMGYLNPVECMGYRNFVDSARSAGVDGVLTVDMPPEEASDLTGLLKEAEIAPIFLLAPNSSAERIRKMSSVGSGFLYYVSLKGVTGASHLDLPDVARKIREIREHTDLPIGVGFGVKDAETAASIARIADAVVVGSALINRIESALGQPEEEIRRQITGLLHSMRVALDN